VWSGSKYRRPSFGVAVLVFRDTVTLLACYVDESGDTGILPNPTSPVQPLLCVLGVSLDLNNLHQFNSDFIDLKQNYFPGLFPAGMPRLSRILKEIKGVGIRRPFIPGGSGRSRKMRTNIGFLDGLLELVERNNCKIFGRVWIKQIGESIDHWAIYTASIQGICSAFQNLLESEDRQGIIILDPRTQNQDSRVSHSIYTQKFKVSGDKYSKIVEIPTFGRSENFAGIQVADLICSALLYPIAAYSYCTGYVNNIHVGPGYSLLKTRYGIRLQHLQHRFQDPVTTRWRGGIVTDDRLGRRRGSHLFV